MEWIKCSERKPDVDGRFQDAGTNNDEGMEDWDGNVFHVTHWMPLPPPPTE